jgi:hypothetical protein
VRLKLLRKVRHKKIRNLKIRLRSNASNINKSRKAYNNRWKRHQNLRRILINIRYRWMLESRQNYKIRLRVEISTHQKWWHPTKSKTKGKILSSQSRHHLQSKSHCNPQLSYLQVQWLHLQLLSHQKLKTSKLTSERVPVCWTKSSNRLSRLRHHHRKSRLQTKWPQRSSFLRRLMLKLLSK